MTQEWDSLGITSLSCLPQTPRLLSPLYLLLWVDSGSILFTCLSQLNNSKCNASWGLNSAFEDLFLLEPYCFWKGRLDLWIVTKCHLWEWAHPRFCGPSHSVKWQIRDASTGRLSLPRAASGLHLILHFHLDFCLSTLCSLIKRWILYFTLQIYIFIVFCRTVSMYLPVMGWICPAKNYVEVLTHSTS